MTEIEKSIRAVKDGIANSGRPTITGALLGELIKKVAPDLDVRKLIDMPTGSGSVSKFAEMYLQDVIRKSGKQGSDLVYTIGENGGSAAVPADVEKNSRIWQEFVRPGSSYYIVCQLSENEDPLLYLETKVPEGAFAIANATYEELDEIRADFTKIANESSGFVGVPQLVAKAPYAEWSDLLKKRSKSLYRQWVEFRIDRIVQLFDSRLASVGIDSQKRQKLCEKLKHSQRLNRVMLNPQVVSESVIQPSSARPEDTLVKRDSELQSIVIQAIRALTDAEIRDLRIPVGAFWDAIKNKQ